MPRKPRIWIPGGTYHVSVRGNNRAAIFRHAADYQQYLVLLGRCRAKYPHQVLAFALMPNHVHLLLKSIEQISLSRVMHWLNLGYAKYVNERYDRVGHVNQGRFYSNLVDRDAYLLEVTRYIHLNPVRAQLVAHPKEYVWSSYRMYIGLDRDRLDLLRNEEIMAHFGVSVNQRVRGYQDFVERLAAEEYHDWLRSLTYRKLIPPRVWLQSEVLPV